MNFQVDARLIDLRVSAAANKSFLNEHISSVVGFTTDAKRKWQAFSMQAESNANDNADFSAAKHCNMELLLQKWLVLTPDQRNDTICIFAFPKLHLPYCRIVPYF